MRCWYSAWSRTTLGGFPDEGSPFVIHRSIEPRRAHVVLASTWARRSGSWGTNASGAGANASLLAEGLAELVWTAEPVASSARTRNARIALMEGPLCRRPGPAS